MPATVAFVCPPGYSVDAALAAAAFGDRPGLHPLPAATCVRQRWLRAVALGGQGFYSGARSELTRLEREVTQGSTASFAASTRASLLRQLGWHRQAAEHDGRALALAGAASPRTPEEATRLVEAQCDALTGLAADALGCGRLDLSRRLLAQCAERLRTDGGDGETFWRQRIRLHWVTAETALASGDFATAKEHAAEAAARADRSPSARHQVKSDLLRAAAATGDDDLGPARALVIDVSERCAHRGLVPLRWAAAMLAHGIGAVTGADRVRDECAEVVTHRGGRFATLRI
jgi:hypothetical protein